jgi:sugar O-acyltransferase (sialic acid O-acetyltransferase NeuD family)
MLIIGAKGFAKEVLEVLYQLNQVDNIAFYDDINKDIGDFLFNKFPILKNENQVKDFFNKKDNQFTIGIGNPLLRYKLYKKFIKLGGKFTSTISPYSHISSIDTYLGEGTNILSNSIFSPSTNIGSGCLIYYNVIITHDVKIGDFVELSPGATILGRAKIGDYSHIGTNATILPDIIIGKNVTIGAGSVVTKNIPDNSVAVGIPAKIIKTK